MNDDKKRKERSVLRLFCPARLVNQDKKTGSIKVGKTADLVLVEGDASERLSDLRQTRVVMLDGKLMDADALRTAAGFSGRPK
jgi:Amidohydrolase family